MKKDKEFQKLLRELNLKVSRLPGYTEIILKIMTQPLETRIAFLNVILHWLKRYPEMELTGMEIREEKQNVVSINGKETPFKKKYVIQTRYKCQDCQKITEQGGSVLLPGNPFGLDVGDMGTNKGPHLVCNDCYLRDYYEPEYEPDPDWDEREIWEQEQKEREKEQEEADEKLCNLM